jgi:hypothetical protein
MGEDPFRERIPTKVRRLLGGNGGSLTFLSSFFLFRRRCRLHITWDCCGQRKIETVTRRDELFVCLLVQGDEKKGTKTIIFNP